MQAARYTGAGIFALALSVRALHLQQVVAHDPFYDQPSVDSLIYVQWAKQLAAGDWLGNEAFFLSPLYGYLLGLIYRAFGPSFLVPLALNALFGAVTCALTWAIARRLFDARVALAAGLFACFYRMEIFYEGVPLVESTQTLLCAGLTWVALRALETRRARDFAWAGVLTGLAVLARQNLLLFAPPFTAWVWAEGRGREPIHRRAALCGAYLAATAGLMGLATLHNWLAARDPVLVNSTGGIVLYTGWNPDANGAYVVPSLFSRALADDPVEQKDAYRALAEQRVGRAPLRASEVSSYWRGEALGWVAAHPARAAALALEKARLFWNAFEAWDVRSETLARPTSWVLGLPLVCFSLLAPLAVAGIALSAARWRELFPLYLALATHFTTFVVFIALSRYRVPALSVLAVFAGVTPIALWDAVRAERWRRVAAGAAAALAAAWVVSSGVPRENLTMAHFNLGNAYKERHEWPPAIAEYTAALHGAPTYISGWNNLALVYEESGANRELAAGAWRHVLDLARVQGSGRHAERASRHLGALSARAGPP